MEAAFALYGNGGKSILLIDGSKIQATRSGRDVFIHILQQETNLLKKYIYQNILKYSYRHGDNSIGICLVIHYLMDCYQSHYRMLRSRLLQALDAILMTFNHLKDDISNILLKSQLLVPYSSFASLEWKRILCRHILKPATNHNTAETLCDILEQWILRINEAINYRDILKNFESYIILSSNGALKSSYIVPCTQYILDGICKDYSALSGGHSSFREYKFVCVKYIFNEDSEDVTLTTRTTIISSASSATSWAHNMQACSDTYQLLLVRGIFQSLKAHNVNVLLTSSSIDDKIRFEATSSGIIPITCIPPLQLAKFTTYAGVVCYTCTADYMEETQRPSDNAQDNRMVARYGVFNKAEPESFLRKEPFLHIYGINSRKTRHLNGLLPQLVLRASSAQVGAIYMSLLRRCVVMIEKASTKNKSSRYIDNDDHDSAQGMMMYPGAGAMEMIWSILWEKVSEEFKRGHSMAFAPIKEEQTSPFDVIRANIVHFIRDNLSTVGAFELSIVSELLSEGFAASLQQMIRNVSGEVNNKHQHGSSSSSVYLRWRGEMERTCAPLGLFLPGTLYEEDSGNNVLKSSVDQQVLGLYATFEEGFILILYMLKAILKQEII